MALSNALFVDSRKEHCCRSEARAILRRKPDWGMVYVFQRWSPTRARAFEQWQGQT